MTSLAEIIARAEQIAISRGIDPHQSPVIDGTLGAEALYPHALRYVITKDLRNGGSPENYARTINVPFINDIGTLPDTVLREFLCSSYLPDEPYSTYVSYDDYRRHRYDSMLTYYATKGSSFYSTREVFPSVMPRRDFGVADITINTSAVSGVSGSTEISADDIGKRVTMFDAGAIVFDSFIDAYSSSSAFTIRGRALIAGTNGDLYIHRSDHYTTDRATTGVTTTADSATFSCPNTSFTREDLGKRMTVLSAAGAYIADGTILTIVSATSVTLSVKAAASATTATATIYQSDLILGIVTCNAASADGTITVNPPTGHLTAEQRFVGHRLYLRDPSNNLVVDGIIAYRSSQTVFELAGVALQNTSVNTPGFVYRADQYGQVLVVDDVAALADDNIFTSSSDFDFLSITDHDQKDWCVTVITGDNTAVLADGFVQSYGGVGTGTFTLGIGSADNASGAIARFYAPGIPLYVPALPSVPVTSTEDLGIEPKLADDVIMAIADALSGKLSLI